MANNCRDIIFFRPDLIDSIKMTILVFKCLKSNKPKKKKKKTISFIVLFS